MATQDIKKKVTPIDENLGVQGQPSDQPMDGNIDPKFDIGASGTIIESDQPVKGTSPVPVEQFPVKLLGPKESTGLGDIRTREKITLEKDKPTETKPVTTPKPTETPVEKIETIEQFKAKGANLPNLEQFIEDRYSTTATTSGNTVTAQINGENFQWTLDSAGNPIKTSLGKVEDEQPTDQGGIFKSLLNGFTNFSDNIKDSVEYMKGKSQYDVTNKYISMTEDQLYNSYINGEISSELEKNLVSNPNLMDAKEKYNNYIKTKNINDNNKAILDVYNKAVKDIKIDKASDSTQLEKINNQWIDLLSNMGNDENQISNFKDFMASSYPELVTETKELNAKNKQLKELADERDARLEFIIKENPGISINRATMLAARQNKDTNNQIKSLTYEMNELSSNINYQTQMADKEYGYMLNQQARQDQLAAEKRGYAFSALSTLQGQAFTQQQNEEAFQRNLQLDQLQKAYDQAITAQDRIYAKQQLDEARAYSEQQDIKQLEQNYAYTYGDLNSTDPNLQNIAIERAVASMYENYPLPGLESQSVKVNKIKQLIAQGKTGTEAIAQVEAEIRNSQRYKDYLASQKVGGGFGFTNVGGGTIAITDPNTGEVTFKSPEITTSVGNTSDNYLSKPIGDDGGECGYYANRATGQVGTPGGNSKDARIEAFKDTSPTVGGQILFTGEGYNETYGHIAVVTGINAENGTVDIIESNLNGDQKVTRRTLTADDVKDISGYYNNTPLAKGQEVSQEDAGKKLTLARVRANAITDTQIGKVQEEAIKGGWEDELKLAIEDRRKDELGEQTFKIEQGLRKEFDGLDEVKAFKEAIIQNQNIISSLESSTGPGDVGAIFSFMKALDPGSVVRESEFQVAAESAGLLEQAKTIFPKLTKGKKLSKIQSEQFGEIAKNFVENRAVLYDRVYNQYSDNATRQGLDPKFVVGEKISDLLKGNSNNNIITPDQTGTSTSGVYKSNSGATYNINNYR